MVYEGQFDNSFADGIGRLVDREQNQYEGQFKNGLHHGQGKYTTKDNKIIEGEWECGKIKSSKSKDYK